MIQVSEASVDRAPVREVEATRQVYITLHPESVKNILFTCAAFSAYRRYLNSGIFQLKSLEHYFFIQINNFISYVAKILFLWSLYLGLRVWPHVGRLLKSLEQIINKGVPTVEERITHCRCFVSHNTKTFLLQANIRRYNLSRRYNKFVYITLMIGWLQNLQDSDGSGRAYKPRNYDRCCAMHRKVEGSETVCWIPPCFPVCRYLKLVLIHQPVK